MEGFAILKIQIDRFRFFKAQFFLNIILAFTGVFVQISILQIFSNNQSIPIYVCISIALSNAFATNHIPEFCKALKKGEIVRYYTRPLSIFHQVCMEEIGNCIAAFLPMLPLIIIAFYLSSQSIIGIVSVCISFILSLILSVFISIVVYSISLWLGNFAATKALLVCFSTFFSGAMIPLIMLPKSFQSLAYKTPFAVMVDGPVSILNGTQNNLEIIFLQGIWIILSYILAKFMFQYFEKKVRIFGG